MTQQIRAARLSGDCTLWNEVARGNLTEGLTGQQKRCIM